MNQLINWFRWFPSLPAHGNSIGSDLEVGKRDTAFMRKFASSTREDRLKRAEEGYALIKTMGQKS